MKDKHEYLVEQLSYDPDDRIILHKGSPDFRGKRCGGCGKDAVSVSLNLRIPKQRNKKEWKKLEQRINNGEFAPKYNSVDFIERNWDKIEAKNKKDWNDYHKNNRYEHDNWFVSPKIDKKRYMMGAYFTCPSQYKCDYRTKKPWSSDKWRKTRTDHVDRPKTRKIMRAEKKLQRSCFY